MKKRIYIAWLLMVVSMVMLSAAVLPHHHHHGLICIQHDVEQPCDEDAPACEQTCITNFQLPQQHFVVNVSPDYRTVDVLFTLASFFKLVEPEEPDIQQYARFSETLYSSHWVHASGLRAPPCLC